MKQLSSNTPIPLSEGQLALLRDYEVLLKNVNRNVNLLSRSEREHLWEHHILHCLVLAVRSLPGGARIIDWGTGGGLPAIPLAIAWPDVEVLAVDSNNKKTHAVALFSRRLGLENVRAVHARAETVSEWTDWSVSRATAPLDTLWEWHTPCASRPRSGRIESDAPPEQWKKGLICLKGGDLTDEIAALHTRFPGLTVDRYPVEDYLADPYYGEKEILNVYAAGDV